MVIQCCICKRIRVGEEWVDLAADGVPEAPISHSYCPGCAASAFDEVTALAVRRRDYEAASLAKVSNE